MFATASAAAARIAGLTWFMIILSFVILVLVVAIMATAIARGRHRDAHRVDLDEKGNSWLLWGGAVMPAAVLLTIVVFALRLMYDAPKQSPVATIHVTGHQWWWQLDYELPQGTTGGSFRSANELHIPVGRPVRLLLTSSDVIHSFWVPQLSGKLDLIPGDTNELRIEASRAGRFTGACAEYCGTQHAHMAITVVAEDSASFAVWLKTQTADASPPHDSLTTVGERLFATGPCIACHTVRGVAAKSDVGPDLTHVASRLTLASGTLPTSLGAIEGWIANPQALKPGVLMPRLDAYTGPELRALSRYVASLK
jgi:cytochrome c oxidase subunit 2